MTWDDAYNQLEEELGREPKMVEVQQRLLELAGIRIPDAEIHSDPLVQHITR